MEKWYKDCIEKGIRKGIKSINALSLVSHTVHNDIKNASKYGVYTQKCPKTRGLDNFSTKNTYFIDNDYHSHSFYTENGTFHIKSTKSENHEK